MGVGNQKFSEGVSHKGWFADEPAFGRLPTFRHQIISNQLPPVSSTSPVPLTYINSCGLCNTILQGEKRSTEFQYEANPEMPTKALVAAQS